MGPKIITNKTPKTVTNKTPKTIEEIYQKKTQIEHILLRPDTYIGDVKVQKEVMWIYSSELNKIVEKEILYVSGLYKIFDEIIVNASDRVQEDETCNIIKVTINSDTNTISVWNNGLGIPVKKHLEHGIYVPSLIFGELLTGSSYDDDKPRTTGGRNGYGAKLANIYSKFFSVETVDSDEKLKFYQEFKENMSIKETPKITKLKADSPKSYTCITFNPDLERFGLTNLTPDIVSLFEKRVYDLAGINNNITVYLNDKKILSNNFKKYIEMYKLNIINSQINEADNSDDESTETSKNSKTNQDLIGSKKLDYEIIYDDSNPRWKVGVVYAPNNDFKQISFVNGICTYHGGSHVDYIVGSIIDKIKTQIKKKHSDLIIKPSSIKENIIIFINSTIINPTFTSQVKETLKTKISDFGSICELPDKFIKKIYASGIVDQVISLVKMKEQSLLVKKADGKKSNKILGIPKLEDANFAGTKKSSLCYLILTEGDSAKALAMSGLSIVGQDEFGVFPLKGKLLNVREATNSQIMKNEEIINIIKILGLKIGKTYNDTSELRYGQILIMTDQDSVSHDTPLLLRKNNILEIKSINEIGSEWKHDVFNNKYFGVTDYEVWTERGWTKIKKVIKHTIKKKMFRVLTHSGLVDVTEDHSLLNKDATEVSPKDIQVGQELLHESLLFNDFQVNIPDHHHLESLDIYYLYYIASKLRIYNYQNMKKNELIPIIESYKNKYYHTFNNNNNYNVTPENAYLTGLEFSIKCRNMFNDKFEITDNSVNRLPIDILNNNYEIRRKFAQGYYDGYNNGYDIGNGNRYDIGNGNGNGDKLNISDYKIFHVKSKITAQELFMLHRSIGYDVSISHNIIKPTIYTLTITKETQNVNPNKINEIFDLGVQECDVYDLETENHHFQAGIGSMIVHNTDGYHIKGLLINFIHFFWPSLITTDNFIFSLPTPIVKAIKNTDVIEFYNLSEYTNWKNNTNTKPYRIKYYKGLGTSTKEEAKQYFTGLKEKILKYGYDNQSGGVDNVVVSEKNDTDIKKTKKTKKTTNYDSEEEDDEDTAITTTVTRKYNDDTTEAITLAFEKNRSNDRKAWLMSNDKKNITPQLGRNISIPNFVNQELILFSYEDCDRSLPSVVDGLKPSQRKVLYGCFLKKIYTISSELRVSQLAGYISEKTAYHHGEASIIGTIIKMAQDYVGSNNTNVLVPSGQFGCLAPDTPVFLWDGRIVLAENIQIGHELIGDDGNKRTVAKITSGCDDMYKITDINNTTMTVNSQHILTLYFSDNNIVKWKDSHNEWFFSYFDGINIKTITVKTSNNSDDLTKISKEDGYKKIFRKSEEIKELFNTNDIIDIKLQDYLHLSTFAKSELYMISNLHSINWDKKSVPIDPYIFGAWLGEGDLIKTDYNPFTEILLKNNNIPDEYLINNTDTRLQLLAGFIDTGGIIINNNTDIVTVEINIVVSDIVTVDISQLERLECNVIEQIIFIAKSLGFATSISFDSCDSKNTNTESNKIITLKIFGNNIFLIPTRVKRKKIVQLNSGYNTKQFTKFTVEHLGKNKFCGWSIDGNERFLLANFIVTHNSRLLGGADHSSPRYINTFINEITRAIYKIDDDAILNYLDDDGKPIEPEYFVPIWPTILSNGGKGVGTGFSFTVPKFWPKEIVENLIAMIDGKYSEIKKLVPWYKGFKGTILASNNPGSYLIYGKYQIVDEITVRVTELPIGSWTSDYKEFLEAEIENKNIVSYIPNNTDETVEFTIIFEEEKLDKLKKKKEIYKKLKLISRISTNNMYLYDPNGVIKKYATPQDILDDFYQVRLDMYVKRKIWLTSKLQNELDLIQYKMKFIQFVLDDKIIIFKQKKSVIINRLIELQFPKLITKAKKNSKDDNDDNDDNNNDNDDNNHDVEEDNNDKTGKSFEYITSLKLFTLTEEKIEELQIKLDSKQQELNIVTSTSEKDQWKIELNEFLSIYNEWSEIKPVEFTVKTNKTAKNTKKSTKNTKKTTKIINNV